LAETTADISSVFAKSVYVQTEKHYPPKMSTEPKMIYSAKIPPCLAGFSVSVSVSDACKNKHLEEEVIRKLQRWIDLFTVDDTLDTLNSATSLAVRQIDNLKTDIKKFRRCQKVLCTNPVTLKNPPLPRSTMT
jgi:hypothetical protein